MNFMSQFSNGGTAGAIGKRSREDGHLSKDEYEIESSKESAHATVSAFVL